MKRIPTCLMAIALMALAAGPTARAASTLNPSQIVLRPLTPGDKTVYGLPSSSEVSGGLKTVGVGTPVYLDAEVDISIPAANIISVVWALTSQPIGSVVALTSSPLGTNVPVYEPADRLIYKVAGRTLLRPDLAGQYTVTATITTSSGATNLTATITAGTYMGANTCALCHSGGLIAEDMYQSWQTTAHSMIFSNGINGYLGSYSASCLPCHTVGYDTNTNAVNGGFDDVMKQTGWVFPAVLTNSNWAAMPAALRNLGNIQCENCHGPGSQHAYSLGDTNLITKTVNSGDCNQCHDAPTHHIKGTEWYVSGHANTTRIPTGSDSRAVCIRCHTSTGFITFQDGTMGPAPTTNTTFSAIGCQTCHEPHGQTIPTNNPHLLRILGSVTMPDGTVITNAGEGALCLQCHHNRNGSVTNMLAKFPLGQPNWAGGSSFGTHDGPQGDMIEGVNAVTYGQTIPSSAHHIAVTNLCVGCHMQTVASGDPAFLLAGGHTFNMSYNVVTNGVTNVVNKVDACVQCHGPIPSFNMVREDYNGDGVIEGVQTEVQHLLDTLSTLLPNGNGVIDGLAKSPSAKTNWSTSFLKAAYNWQFVSSDGSLGVHNAQYAVGLLKASITDLTGDPSARALSASNLQFYAWQVANFGSATSPNAALNATPANDGIPNWLKYSLGISPWTPATTNGFGGIVWANSTALGGNNSTNTVQIYTAAEVTFNTQVGKTYYIQEATSLIDGWQTIAGPITGTGDSYSYLTQTRNNVQQFFKVYHTP